MNIEELRRLSGLNESVDEKKAKILSIPRQHGLKLIWQWVKQDAITLQEFSDLIYQCYGDGLNTHRSQDGQMWNGINEID